MSQLVSYTVGQFDPSVFLLCHRWLTTTNLSYRFPILETSATALCGTTGINDKWIKYHLYSLKRLVIVAQLSLSTPSLQWDRSSTALQCCRLLGVDRLPKKRWNQQVNRGWGSRLRIVLVFLQNTGLSNLYLMIADGICFFLCVF